MMFQRAIRGAITVSSNSAEDISSASIELVKKILWDNSINTGDISHVIFSMTEDLTAVYPAKAPRENIEGFSLVPLFCVQEQKINNSLKMCLRVLMVVNTLKTQGEIKHVYLRGAKVLRADIADE